jgi:Beta-carotene isomerase D27-like, C-terminal
MTKSALLLTLCSFSVQRCRYAEGFLYPFQATLPQFATRTPPPIRDVTVRLSLPTPSTSPENTDRSSVKTDPANKTRSHTDEIQERIYQEANEVVACLQIAAEPFLKSAEGSSGITSAIVQACDQIDSLSKEKDRASRSNLWVNQNLQLRRRAFEAARYDYLCRLLQTDYDVYVTTATFLSPSRIPREKLPNVQDVPMSATRSTENSPPVSGSLTPQGDLLVPDCELDDLEYHDSPLDTILLRVFRDLVEQNTGGIASDKPGIAGLLEQGRNFMLLPGQTSDAQHEMVRKTLGGLMTPFLPPFYRIFMAGIVPSKLGTKWDGQQLGPWFYAPWLTSVVTPPFFQFLVGPSTPNRRKDGQLGGLLVQKCKFLQESNCKGLCLHQCKLPAQQFFAEELGVPLSVSPNFVTQECQWSFGEVPVPPPDDPSFPAGCLAGCESRRQMAAMISSGAPNGVKADLCSY